MNKVLVRCDRCGGAGIFYVGVNNGHGVPAQPDAGVCYKCWGRKYIALNLNEKVEQRILKFMEKHNLVGIFRDYAIDNQYVYLYMQKAILRFGKYDNSAMYKLR